MSITDWDKRLLCPDGTCVGVIGTDGTCKVCGAAAPNWGDDRRRGLKTTGELKGARGATVPAPEDEHLAAAASAVAADGDEDDADDGDDDDGDDDGAGDDDAGDEDDDDDEDDEDSEGDDDSGAVHAAAPETPSAGKRRVAKGSAPPAEWEQRELCSNGACIGVIGDDGKCRTCGATA